MKIQTNKGFILLIFVGLFLVGLSETTALCWQGCGCSPPLEESCWTCFPAGTMITMSDGSKTPIENIEIGDRVLSQSEDDELSISTVSSLDQPIRNHMCEIIFDQGKLQLTDEHPIFSEEGWKSIEPLHSVLDNPNLIVKKLEIGDRILMEGNVWNNILSISCWSEELQAYNLLFSNGAHTYFADGVLAHNKDHGGGGGGCTPVCTNKECGTNGCPGGSCGSCAGKSFIDNPQCTTGRCMFKNAQISNVAVSKPCISENAASKQFVVSANNEYCGDITIKVNYSNGVEQIKSTANTYANHAFTKTFTIPNSVDILTNPVATVTITGNRQTIKDSTDELIDYTAQCTRQRVLRVDYLNFFYCPTSPESTINTSTFDYYDDISYFTFYGNDQDYKIMDPDTPASCISDDSIQLCTSKPTDCINENGERVPENTINDSDSDNEFEYCYSTDNIQGGWMDADLLKIACDKVDDLPTRESLWFNCPNPTDAKCQYGQDDFPNDQQGMCCGDDEAELPTQTKYKDPNVVDFVPDGSGYLTEDACCDGDINPEQRCVDESNICRPVGYDYCLAQGGVRAKCEYLGSTDDYYWKFYDDSDCHNLCIDCDVNEDGVFNDVDIVAIQQNSTNDPALVDSTYDIDGNDIVDTNDWTVCANSLSQEQVCDPCVKKYNDGENVCMTDDDDTILFRPDSSILCSANPGNYTVKERDDSYCGAFCNSKYDNIACNSAECGGCEEDNDCSGNSVCRNDLCACDDYEPGREYSIHIDESNCGYRFCVSADNSDSKSNITIGYIRTNTNFSIASGSKFESGDSLTLNTAKNEISYISSVTNNEDCIDFTTTGEVTYGFNSQSQKPALSDIYFEPQDTHPTAIPFKYSTSQTNSCRVCVKSQNVETQITDGLDNDCDGLVDEPSFEDYGVYIWEANCDYFMCAYSDDGDDHLTKGKVNAQKGFSESRVHFWESTQDIFNVDSTRTKIDFTSNANNDIDCIIMKTTDVMDFTLNLTGYSEASNIYLGQRKLSPLANPFKYASPECSNGCSAPDMCGDQRRIISTDVRVNCGYDECIFDCGGYWVDVDSTYDDIPVNLFSNPEDYCSSCRTDMVCSNYTNEYSCAYDSCLGSESRFGCDWDGSECVDLFEQCVPGTTLCSDGICRENCYSLEIAGCDGYPNNECTLGEGCLCDDCIEEQASCTNGAVCDDEDFCNCPADTTLCSDGTCDDNCKNNGGKQSCIGDANGVCDFKEGCACEDCSLLQDSCIKGLICDTTSELCEEDTTKCKENEALCVDGTCDDTCNNNGGKKGCIGSPNNRCEVGEGCACDDCDNKKDHCGTGLVCEFDTKLCEKSSTGGGGDQCIDNDYDGYYKEDIDCIGSNDCNDNNEYVNTGMNEICDNNVDDDCDGFTDNDCLVVLSVLDVSVQSQDDLRVFEKFKLNVEVKNNRDVDVSQIELEVKAPEGVFMDKSFFTISNLVKGSYEDVEFNMYIKDFTDSVAEFEIKVSIPGSDEVNQILNLDVDVPDFLVAAENVKSNNKEDCYDFYYVFNQGDIGKVDIEYNVFNPNAFLSKTVTVDYLSGLNVNGKTIGKINRRSYCIAKDKDFELHGFLYKPTPGVFIDRADASIEKLNDKATKEVNVLVEINT